MLNGFKSGLLAALMLGMPVASRALTIADPVKGGEYSLSVQALDSNTWLATLSIDLDPLALEIPATSIDQIEFKVANSYAQPVSIVSAPDATSNWLVQAGPLTGSGCRGNNGSFVCVGAVNPLSIGSATLFTWQVQFDADSLLPESDWHIGARYTSPTHSRGWVVSLSPSPIPEPTSGLLLAAGMLIAGAAVRRSD